MEIIFADVMMKTLKEEFRVDSETAQQKRDSREVWMFTGKGGYSRGPRCPTSFFLLNPPTPPPPVSPPPLTARTFFFLRYTHFTVPWPPVPVTPPRSCPPEVLDPTPAQLDHLVRRALSFSVDSCRLSPHHTASDRVPYSLPIGSSQNSRLMYTRRSPVLLDRSEHQERRQIDGLCCSACA